MIGKKKVVGGDRASNGYFFASMVGQSWAVANGIALRELRFSPTLGPRQEIHTDTNHDTPGENVDRSRHV